MRGIFLRRRFRRRLEEAIAAGVLLTPSDDGMGGFGPGRSPRRKLQRPTLYDVSVLPPYFATSTPQDGSWEKLMPFSGNISAEKPGADPQQDPSSAAQGASPPRHGHRPAARALLERAGYLIPRTRLRRPRTNGSATPAFPASASGDASSSASENIPLEPQPQDAVQRATEVRVAVVIAMPDPHRSSYVPPAVDAEMHAAAAGNKGKARGVTDGWGDAGDVEAGVPDVVVGTARLAVAAAAELDEGAPRA
ncbi:hypothetical protein C8Q80DRAFT_400992 [Daedaleopsis nitida]|nr:hypothetical protein C8Q80DRAFT_400992 [Daedaleopsis nitida]